MIGCPVCSKDNNPTSKFCKHCGSPMVTTCIHCEAENEVNSKFCITCGDPLTTASFGGGDSGKTGEQTFLQLDETSIAGNVVYEALAFKALCSQFELDVNDSQSEEEEIDTEETHSSESWKGVPFPFSQEVILSIIRSNRNSLTHVD